MRTLAHMDVATLFDSAIAAPYDDDELPVRTNGNACHTNGNPTHEVTPHTKDRFAVLNGFVDVSMRTVTTTDAVVWFVLYRETKPNGVAKVSQKQIADVVGVDERTVRRAIERLRAAGLLVVSRRGGIGRGASCYRVRDAPSRQK